MYIGAPRRRLSHLWQLPLLLVSVALFAVAARLFVDARPGLTLNQKLSVPRELLRNDRPDAAVEAVTRLMAAEKFPREQEAQVHLLLAEALDAAQKQKKRPVASGRMRIIEETQVALAQGVKPTGEMHRRLGENYEALGKPVEAVSQYRQAIAMDPARAMPLRRKVIDLQIAQSEWAPAEASLDAYLASSEITDTERAWGRGAKAQLLVDRGEYVDAKRLLEEALRLDPDPTAQAEAKYRLGLCAWKLGNTDEAQKLIADARGVFQGQHPLDAEATYTLGRIAAEKNDVSGAIALFDAVVANYADSPVAPMARLMRGTLRVRRGGGDDDERGVADLKAVAEQAKLASASSPLRTETLGALQKASAALASRDNQQAAVDLLLAEQSLDGNPSAGFFARLATAYEKRADQVEQSLADVPAADKVRRGQLMRDLLVKAGDAQLAYSRALAAAGDKGYLEPLWKALDLFDRGDAKPNAIAALELFVTERADDAAAPDALLRLARTYESAGRVDKAMSAYGRLQGAYGKSPAAVQAAVSLAALLEKQPDKVQAAKTVLIGVIENPAVARDGEPYRQALFELANLNCRAGEWKEATPRLEQFTSRFASDPRMGEAVFLLGECYRDAARQIDAQLASASASASTKAATGDMERAMAAKIEQLRKAAAEYDRAAQVYGGMSPTREADQKYQKLAGLRRADCAYEQGAYDEAIARYDRVATQYPDDPVAVAACVQIVNAYCAMNKLPQARAANERARALLSKMPRDAKDQGGVAMPRAYWEQWLKWTATAAAAGAV